MTLPAIIAPPRPCPPLPPRSVTARLDMELSAGHTLSGFFDELAAGHPLPGADPCDRTGSGYVQEGTSSYLMWPSMSGDSLGPRIIASGPAGVVTIEDGARSSAARRRWLLSTAAPAAIGYAGLGTAIGLLLGGLHAVGGAVGAAVGLYLAWDNAWNDRSGRVKVAVDGVDDSRPFYDDPSRYERTPKQLHALLHTTGILGDQIAPTPADVCTSGTPDAPVLNAFAQVSDKLSALAQARRLVADLGQTSLYERAVLHPVTATQGCDLLARGQAVYVLNGCPPREIPHSYQSWSQNPRATLVSLEDYASVERRFDYTLKRIGWVDDVRCSADAVGLPVGLNGVYRDLTSVSQNVYQDASTAWADLDSRRPVRKQNSVAAPVDPPRAALVGPRQELKVSRRYDLRKLAGFFGFAAGELAVVGILGNGWPSAQIVAGAAGALGGRWVANALWKR